MNHSPEQPATQKKGSINKCPSCGSQLSAFVSSCEACGHEFTDIDANRSITALVDRFDDIEREVDAKGIKGKGA
jgi:transcription initiation factor IIE alpha subunit